MTASDDDRLDAPRHDLIRGLAPMRAEDDGNVMVGYPVVFNQWTEINSWEGHFLERVLSSGPKKAIQESADRIKVQYNHGMHPVIGTSGLGKPRTIEARRVGVYTETPLSDTSYNRDIIKPLLADGVLNGMSFRFSVIEDRWKRPTEPTDHNPEMLPERSLVEFKWHEFGPVDWPAYEAALAGIRSQAAFALWVQTPQEQRSELLRQHHIASPPDPRIWVPGWDPPKITAPPEERQEPAGEDATDTTEGEPDQSTRSEEEPPPEEVSDYTPAQRTPLSPERRQAQKGMVQAFLAHTSKE
jgi:HK97 family phage prohead protease